jgi:integrase
LAKTTKARRGPIFGFHTLRHFMASYMADQGKWSTKTLQRLLRHKEVRTTEIYLHALGDGLREAAQGVEGKFSILPSASGDEKAVKSAKNE